ncbi:uroporphyrinogen-iii synthase [Grosmannia clavigera kw1407]|uniref:Uroporphyrinogen-iii synthase n=1 Tax=Grosmannia clavigera (strain kw1407 / UAMH 11150) TaxID=655863 RepID=F0XNG5_GROCL|nr:uroporphyrinogen-iii synthase [Grosmannia clavigera kw1407]EFX00776.1 uroporphyrinogen-iii synthase [Grosmannia clavigera kw1407]
MATPTSSVPATPVLLLKTKSSPTDAYEDHFAEMTGEHGGGFDPIFVPVLEHRFDDDGVAQLRDVLVRRRIASTGEVAYGGLIFTSQRAVEAFARVVAEGEGEGESESRSEKGAWPHLQDVPTYSVGPATTRALRAVPQQPPLQVVGDHTGNGEDLAYFIREHYAIAQPVTPPPPLLFLVGEKRRDVIPRVLMDPTSSRPVRVDEVVVYGTGEMPSFAADLDRVLTATRDRPCRWVVVFSPTGCDRLLAGLGLLDPATGRVHGDGSPVTARSTYVATIGPTTRAFLRDSFGFEPDVCADEPTPAGVSRGITRFMAAQTLGH